MSESYQREANSGAEPNQPIQASKTQAEGGISEKAEERPDVSGDKEAGDKPALPEQEYPEQKHAGAAGIGPNYAEARGKVTLGERIGGLKEEIKGKVTRNPDLVREGREQRSGEAKRRKLEEENNPHQGIGGPDPEGADKKDEDEDDKGDADKKDAEGDANMKDAEKNDDKGAHEQLASEQRRADERTEDENVNPTDEKTKAKEEEIASNDRKVESKVESERNQGDKTEMPQ